MNYYILIIKNRIKYQIQDDIDKFVAWLKKYTPLNPQIFYLETDLDVSYKDFGVKNAAGQLLCGLDGIKEKLRQTGLIENNAYNSIIFLYECINCPSNIAAWAYPNPLLGASFCEIPSSLFWEKIDDLYRLLTHEIIHCFYRILWWKGIALQDTMDTYRFENDIEHPQGNRAENLARIAPYWNKISESPLKRLLISLLQQIVLLYQKLVKRKSVLEKMAEAIKKYEGWYVGSRSYRNNNPGNLKYNSQKGAIGADTNGFAVFGTYQDGWNALINQIDLAFSGKSKLYYPEMTLIEFFNVYAPKSDNNDPNAYALFVAQKLGVSPQTKLKDLI